MIAPSFPNVTSASASRRKEVSRVSPLPGAADWCRRSSSLQLASGRGGAPGDVAGRGAGPARGRARRPSGVSPAAPDAGEGGRAPTLIQSSFGPACAVVFAMAATTATERTTVRYPNSGRDPPGEPGRLWHSCHFSPWPQLLLITQRS